MYLRFSLYFADYKHRRLKREPNFLGSKKICRLFVIADYEFHKNVGGSNKHTTARYIVNMLCNQQSSTL